MMLAHDVLWCKYYAGECSSPPPVEGVRVYNYGALRGLCAARCATVRCSARGGAGWWGGVRREQRGVA